MLRQTISYFRDFVINCLIPYSLIWWYSNLWTAQKLGLALLTLNNTGYVFSSFVKNLFKTSVIFRPFHTTKFHNSQLRQSAKHIPHLGPTSRDIKPFYLCLLPKPFDNKPSHSTYCHLAIGSGTNILPIQ